MALALLQGSGRGAGKAKLKHSFAPLGNPAGSAAAQSRQSVQSPAREWSAPFRGAAAATVGGGEAAVGWEFLRSHVPRGLALRLETPTCPVKTAVPWVP